MAGSADGGVGGTPSVFSSRFSVAKGDFGHWPAASNDRSVSTCCAFRTQSISSLPSTTTGDGLPIVTLVVFVDSP